MDIFQGYVEDAGFSPRSFDVVVMKEVVEHLTDPVGVLRSVRAVLKDDGILYLSTPDISSIEARLKRQRWCMIYVNSHYYFYSPRSLGYLLNRVGMRIRERILWEPGGVWWKDRVKWGFSQLGIATHRLTAVIEKNVSMVEERDCSSCVV